MHRQTIITLAFVLLTGFSGLVFAENSTKIAGYTIHHNALTTDALSPQIAKTYNIRRSSNRALLNVSVMKDSNGGLGKAVTAKVKATAKNLQGQPRDIELREIREGNAIYYIGDFLVANREHLNFEFEILPEGASDLLRARMSQDFYTQ